MNDTTAQLELRPLPVPLDLRGPGAMDFNEMTRVRNLVYREIAGDDDDSVRPEELLPRYRPTPDETRYLWLAVWAGRVVGRVGLDIPHEDGSDTAFWFIELLREVHGRGIGTAALQLIEQTALAHDRHVLQSYVQHPERTGERLPAPTGHGEVPLDRAARFLLGHGYRLEQIYRKSVLDLASAAATVDAHLLRATEAASGYRVVS